MVGISEAGKVYLAYKDRSCYYVSMKLLGNKVFAWVSPKRKPLLSSAYPVPPAPTSAWVGIRQISCKDPSGIWNILVPHAAPRFVLSHLCY